MLEELLYPAHCVACERPGAWLCSFCEAKIHLFTEPLAALALPSGQALVFTRVFALAAYAHKPWSALITSIKYDGLRAATPILVRIFASSQKALASEWPFGDGTGWTLIPAPTNPDHVEERGGDHLDAWLAAVKMVLPHIQLARETFKRRSGAPAHASLHVPGAREAAIQGGLVLAGAVPQRVLLFDDVYTSGATLQTCARLLQEAGCREIEALVGAASFSQEKTTV